MKTAIRKSDRLAFNAAVTGILAQFHQVPDGSVRCMTDHGPLTITPDPLEHGDRIPTVFLRFRERGTPFGGYSGKWNVHEYTTDQCVDELKRRLALVNARRLTDEELAEWQAVDAAENARWERLRKEFQIDSNPDNAVPQTPVSHQQTR